MASSPADVNLLFGILAVQMNFIGRDALIEAMNAWVLHKHRPLGAILVEQGKLRQDRHDALQALVAMHLELHDNDAHKSLRALTPTGSVRAELARIADGDVQASIGHVAAATDEADPARTVAPLERIAFPGVRYRKVRPHARGGLGEVFVAQDEELHRQVALKEIQGQHADHDDSRARFVQEAEITGQLEHPGIVPVYGLGRYDDGRPFYAMRFIQEGSLKEAIERFHQQEGAADAGQREVELRGLLRRFLDVCDAVAYAHSRGVLHRDLKPHNVMLGTYGETLVVDWGMARLLQRSDLAAASQDAPPGLVLTAEATPTQAGKVVGTPQYMSPEQAEGRLDLLGPASDVYSLGATLYYLLTGQPPFPAPGAEGLGPLLRKVQQGEFAPPRQVKPELARPLAAICRKAMARRREDRYASVEALARDLQQWLAGEPVSAWPEPLRVKASRWVRKHQVLAAATAATLVVTLVLGSGAAVWWQQRQEQERLAQLERQQRAALRGEALMEQAAQMRQRMRWAAARLLLKQAGEAVAEAQQEDLAEQLEQVGRDLELASALDKVRQDSHAIVDGKWDPRRRVKEGYPQAFRKHGLDVLQEEAQSLAERIVTSAVRQEILAALDDWSRGEEGARQRRLLQLTSRVDRDNRWRQELQEGVALQDVRRVRELLGRLKPEGLTPATAVFVAGLLGDRTAQGLELLQRVRERKPDDFWLNFQLANALKVPKKEYDEWRDRSRQEEAIGYYRAALAIKPDSSVAHNNLGGALSDKGDVEGAIRSYQRAIHFDPKHAMAHYNLGNALRDKGDVEGAIRSYQQALRLAPKDALAHTGLGDAFRDNGDIESAIRSFQQAIHLAPKDANARTGMGIALSVKGDVEGAIHSYQQAIRLDPKHARAHSNLGNALRSKGDVEGAIRSYQRAIRFDPKHAMAHYNLGIALSDKGDVEGAIHSYQQAIRLDPKHARAHSNLGNALEAKGDVEGAIRCYQRAIRFDPKATLALNNLGNALRGKGDVEGAIRSYQRAIHLAPKNATVHYNLGLALSDKGDLEGAIRSFQEAIRLDPKLAQAHGALGWAWVSFGDFPRARRSLQKAYDLIPRSHPLSRVTAQELALCQQFHEQEQTLDAVLAGKHTPRDAAQRLALAGIAALPARQLYVTAVRLCTEAFQTQPRLAGDLRAGHRYNAACAAARAGTQPGKEAVPLSDTQRAQMRYRALCWLQDDLEAHARQLARSWAVSGKPSYQALLHWRKDRDLAAVREAASLSKLPEAEQVAWRNLWARVDALLARARPGQ